MAGKAPGQLLTDDWRERLRQVVDGSPYKHSALAREAGIAPETLSRILTGRHQRPAFDAVVMVAHAAGGRVGWILREPGYVLSMDQHSRLATLLTSVADEQQGHLSERTWDTPAP